MGKNIVLVGLMGAGKTSVGKMLSKKYKLKCIFSTQFKENFFISAKKTVMNTEHDQHQSAERKT